MIVSNLRYIFLSLYTAKIHFSYENEGQKLHFSYENEGPKLHFSYENNLQRLRLKEEKGIDCNQQIL